MTGSTNVELIFGGYGNPLDWLVQSLRLLRSPFTLRHCVFSFSAFAAQKFGSIEIFHYLCNYDYEKEIVVTATGTGNGHH